MDREIIAEYLSAFDEAGGLDLIAEARLDYLSGFFDPGYDSTSDVEAEDLGEIAWGFESLGVEALNGSALESDVVELFIRAFRARAAMWERESGLRTSKNLWMLISSGILAQRQPELRLLLKDVTFEDLADVTSENWADRLWISACRAYFLLARKQGRWEDVEASITSLEELAEVQKLYEAAYLREVEGDQTRRLLGLYHLAEALVSCGSYLRTGSPESIEVSVQRRAEHVITLLPTSGDIEFFRIAQVTEHALVSLTRASIWTSTRRLSQAARNFVKTLTDESAEKPISELWWSQREALSQSLLDPFKVAISVQMPTSAGKTLLAEFSIVQSLALNPGGTVAYIVPTRALVNQITKRLRTDLAGATNANENVAVEAAVPIFELDPVEESLLSHKPDVLVTTPEKLDLLVRAKHPVAQNLSLVVIDEAHHLGDPARGSRLELLLATLKREQGKSCRFLLLTPFLPNAPDLAKWLGGADSAAISLDWTPSEQLRALGKWERSKGEYRNVLELLPSITQPHAWEGRVIDLGVAERQAPRRSRPLISASIAARLSRNSGGGCLVLTRGPGVAETRALDIAEELFPEHAGASGDSLLEATIAYVRSQMGEDAPLAAALAGGVAFHHAGLPPEVRSLVETLLERGSIRVITGTSTLAQGVNFPLASVIVESLKVPQGRGQEYRALRFAEFWNIAGRAGRAMQDPIGLVVYPSSKPSEDRDFKRYLQDEAVNVVSALAEAFQTLDDSPEFNLRMVRASPVIGHFLQYLTHALKVSGYERARAEIEEILRSSLAFSNLREQGSREAAEQLIRWSRKFLASAATNSLVSVADVTGLSLPSVGSLAAQAPVEMKDAAFWHPDRIFGEDLAPLTAAVEMLGSLPEMHLGPSDEAGPLNAHRVAGVMRDWVRGKTLPEIASRWFASSENRLSSAGRYLFRDLAGQMPWGLGALQLVGGINAESLTEENSMARHIPAMAFYGVSEASALPLRMVGVPRVSAPYLGREAPKFESFEAARDWVKGLDDAAWARSASSASLSGRDVRLVWEASGGSTG